MAAGASDIPVNSAPIRWTLPAGWKEKPADGIRLGSFAIKGENGGKAEVAITSFPGSVGTELDNVNRWRGELGPGAGRNKRCCIGAGDGGFVQGKLYDITGASARTVVAMIPRNGSSWFIKLRGDTATVAAAKPVFLEFLKSVHFGGDGGAARPAARPPEPILMPAWSARVVQSARRPRPRRMPPRMSRNGRCRPMGRDRAASHDLQELFL
jgi:hypothetical protein